MEGDIKRIFDFGDPLLIHEAASAFYNEILAQKKKQKLELITSKNQHLVSSLSLLWDYLSCSNAMSSRACGCILVQLVKAKALDEEYAHQQLLNVIKVAKCPVSVLHSVADLLIALSKSEDNASFHNTSQHPFVQIVRIRPSLIPQILDSMDRAGNSLGYGHILLPSAFLLLTPDLETYYRSLIFTWLRDLTEKGDINAESFWNVVRFIPEAPDWKPLQMLLKSEAMSKRVQDSLAFAILDNISAAGSIEQTDFGRELCYLERTVPLMKSGSLNLFSMRFSSFLLRLPYEYWKPALKIVEHVWNFACPVYSNLFFAPLVNMNSMIGQLKSIGLSDEEFLLMPKLIQSCLAIMTTRGNVCPVHENGTGIQTVLDVLCHHPKTILPFLRGLLRQSIAPSALNLNLLSSLLVIYRDDKGIASKCCETIAKFVEKDPAKVSIVLPAFIQAASKELTTCKPGEVTVLEFLPKLAVHHICTPTILRFILGLANGQKTREHGYRLLGILYEKQPFIYRQIKGLFDGLVNTTDQQSLVLKMELLLIICTVNGGEHTDDLTTILTSVINKPTDVTTDSAIRSLTLAVTAIGELCRWEVLQADVIWRKLHGKLGKNNGSLLCALCNFAGILGEIMGDADEEERNSMTVVTTQALQFLWNTACSAKTDSICRTASLAALSKFNFRHIPRSVFGTEVSNKETEEQKNGLPGDLIFTLLGYLGDENLEAFSSLLSTLISAETETLGRGAYYNARMMAANQSASSSSLEDFCLSLSAKFIQGGMLEDKSSAVAVLLVYEPPSELSQRGGDVVKKSIVSAGRYYLRALAELLKLVPFEDSANWRLALIIPYGWIKFMDRMYAGVISSRKSEIELAKVTDKQQEMDFAHLWARDKIVETLKSAWRQDGDARPNCSIALAALCLAVKGFSANHVQTNISSSDTPYMDNRHWITLVAETLLGLSAIGHSPTSQDLVFETLDLAPDLSVSNASRLGSGLLLPAIREDVIDFYGNGIFEQFVCFLATVGPDNEERPSTDYSTTFYNLLALGFYQGQLGQMGASIDQTEILSHYRYRNIGGWLGAAVCAVFIDDVQLAESILEVMMEAMKSGDSTDVDHRPAIAVISLISLIIYPNPDQFIRSPLSSRLNDCWSSMEKPGFLSKIFEMASKESHRQAVANRLNKLSTENSPLSDVADSFHWLCSSCGADYFPMVYAGREKKLDGDDRTILNELCKYSKSLLSKGPEESSQSLRGECLLSLATVAFSTKFALADSSNSALPSDYEYLDESSVLRHSIGFLLNGKGSEQRVHSVLKALTTGRTKSLPPMDWDRVYDALDVDTRAKMDEDIVVLAVKERSSALLAKITHPTWIFKASTTARLRLLENLLGLATSLPTNGFQRLLNMVPRLREIDGSGDSVLMAAFKGLRSAFSSISSEENCPISPANQAALWNWTVDACQFLHVESYNDFRTPIVQAFLDAVVGVDQAKAETMAKEISRNRLLAFAIRISSFLRCQDGRPFSGKMEKVVETYLEIGAFCRPSALRILTHELACGSIDEKDEENGLLYLMNLVLLLCKRNDGGDKVNTDQISSAFDVFLASVTAWIEDDGSLPAFLLDETNADPEFDGAHDAFLMEKVLFTDAARQLSGFIQRTANRKFGEKVIEWAFQMLPMLEILKESHAMVVKDVLHYCRSDEFYIRKLQDSAVAERILTYGCGLSIS